MQSFIEQANTFIEFGAIVVANGEKCFIGADLDNLTVNGETVIATPARLSVYHALNDEATAIGSRTRKY